MTRAALAYGATALLVLSVACYSSGDDGAGPAGSMATGSADAGEGGSGGGIDQLTLAAVDWNAAKADVGQVQAVAELDGTIAVFGSKGVTTFESGAPRITDGSISSWRTAAAIPAADGVASWLVGVDDGGHLRHVRAQGAPEDVSARFGLAQAKVQSLSSARTTTGQASPTAFLLETGLAVSDGTTVTTYDGVERAAAAGTGVVAVATDKGVRVLRSGAAEQDIGLPDAALVACADGGAIYAANAHALYVVEGSHARLLFDAGTRTVHALVASGANAWLLVDGEVGFIEDGHFAMTAGQAVAGDAKLFGSPSGDVWLVSGGALQRFSAHVTRTDPEALWNGTVKPVSTAICQNCHGAPGSGKDSSGIDLSTYQAWSAKKTRIYERVVHDHGTPLSMPPPTSGMPLTDAQLEAIDAWAKP